MENDDVKELQIKSGQSLAHLPPWTVAIRGWATGGWETWAASEQRDLWGVHTESAPPPLPCPALPY